MDRTSAANNVNIGGGRRGYRDRNLGAGLRGTSLVAADRNAIQEEILAVIEAAGLSPNASDWTQLLQAGRVVFGGLAGTAGAASWISLGGGMLLQWGAIGSAADIGGTATLTLTGSFPVVFTTACYQLVGTIEDGGVGRASIIGASGSTTTATFRLQEWLAEVQALSVRYLAIGK